MWSPVPDVSACRATGRDKPVPYGRCYLRVRDPAPGVETRMEQISNPLNIMEKARRGDPCGRPHRDPRSRRLRDGTSPSPTVPSSRMRGGTAGRGCQGVNRRTVRPLGCPGIGRAGDRRWPVRTDHAAGAVPRAQADGKRSSVRLLAWRRETPAFRLGRRGRQHRRPGSAGEKQECSDHLCNNGTRGGKGIQRRPSISRAGTALRQNAPAPRFRLSKWTNSNGVRSSVTAVAKVNPPMIERAIGM